MLSESQRKHTNKVKFFFSPCLSFELRLALFPLQRQANGFRIELQHFPRIGSLRDTIFLELRSRLLKMGLLRFRSKKDASNVTCIQRWHIIGMEKDKIWIRSEGAYE